MLCRHAGGGGLAGCGGLRRRHRGEDGGHFPGLRAGGGWLQGPGRDPARRGADVAGSGVRGRRGAAVSPEWVGLGSGPVIYEGVRVSVHGGVQFVRAAFGCRGGRA